MGATGDRRRAGARGERANEVSLVLNGETRSVARSTTLLDLLTDLGRDARTVAVEYNGEILKRDAYGDVVLAPGDRLEIVHFVQGGYQAPRDLVSTP